MRVFVFGNRDYAPDAVVFGVVDKLQATSYKLQGVEFVGVKPNEDLPFAGEELVVIMDVVMGFDKVTMLTEKDLDKLELPPRGSAHEFDLGFQLRYLKKLGKIKKVRIVGLPMGEKVELKRVVELLEKLKSEG